MVILKLKLRGISLICINEIRGDINLSSNSVKPFNSGGIFGNLKLFPTDHGGIFPLFKYVLH